MTGRSVTGARHGASCYFRTAAEDGDRKALAPLGQSRPLAAPAEPEGQRRADGAGEDAPADGDELSPVAKAQLPAASALCHLPSQMAQHRRLAGHPRLWLA